LKDEPLDFLVLCSSINAICGVAGSIDYTAGNCFLDAFAASRFDLSRAKVVSINWDAWRDVGMAFKRHPGSDRPEWKDREYEEIAITPGEGVAAFERILASGLPQVAVIPRDLGRLLEDSETSLASLPGPAASAPAAGKQNRDRGLHSRPDLASEYVAPETEFERLMAEIWSESLGIQEVGIDDNFFELGGHSLLAIAVLAHARTTFGVRLPLRVIFDRPTVRLLSEQLETLLWATSRPAVSGDELEQREEIEL
jgi:acyl carrier protein